MIMTSLMVVVSRPAELDHDRAAIGKVVRSALSLEGLPGVESDTCIAGAMHPFAAFGRR